PRSSPLAQESQNPPRCSGPAPRKCRIPRAVAVHRSGIAESHAQEGSIAQELRISTRGSSPSLRNRRIPRAVVIYRSGIVFFRVQEKSLVWNSNYKLDRVIYVRRQSSRKTSEVISVT